MNPNPPQTNFKKKNKENHHYSRKESENLQALMEERVHGEGKRGAIPLEAIDLLPYPSWICASCETSIKRQRPVDLCRSIENQKFAHLRKKSRFYRTKKKREKKEQNIGNLYISKDMPLIPFSS
jgi:hypothetical protein